MLSRSAIGNLINRYSAVLKKCCLLNTFGSLAVASMLVAGDAGVAGANDISISGDSGGTVSLCASGGAPEAGDKVTTDSESAAGDFDLTIDGREPSLNTMTIGPMSLDKDFSVTLKQGTENVTSITSESLNVVGGSYATRTTLYTISSGLTHTVSGITLIVNGIPQAKNATVSLQGAEGVSRLDVDGTLALNTSGTAASIVGNRGYSATQQVNVTGTLNAFNSQGSVDLDIDYVTLTLDDATVNAASLNVDNFSSLTFAGTTIINGSLNATDAITIDGANLKLNGGGSLVGLTVGGVNDSDVVVRGDGNVLTVNDFNVSSGGVVNVDEGATLDISADADIGGAFVGATSLNGGTLYLANLSIDAGKLLGDSAQSAAIAFNNNSKSVLSVEDTLTLESSGTLASGVNIKTKSLAGVDTTVASGANLTFVGGGSIDTNVSVGGIVNMEGTDASDVATLANQSVITDGKSLTLGADGVINVQKNAVFVLDKAADLLLTPDQGTFNIKNDGALLLKSALDAFDGNNVTNIAGVVNSLDASGDAQNFTLANVKLQAGAKVGSAATDTVLSGIVNVDAMEEGQSAHIMGGLIGRGVSATNFNGILSVAGRYISESAQTNTFGTAGDTGVMNVSGDASFEAGSTSTFNVPFNAANVSVATSQAISDNVSLTMNAGGSAASLSLSSSSSYGAFFNVKGGEFTVDGDVTFTQAEATATSILNVQGGTASGAENGAHTTLTVAGNISGTGILNLQGGDGAHAVGAVAGADGGNAYIKLKEGATVSENVTFIYTGGTGGDGGVDGVIQVSGGAGGDVIINDNMSDTYILTAGAGGDANGGIGGKGGDIILEANDGRDYGIITLKGGNAGIGTNAGAGGNAVFNVTNESVTTDTIIMDMVGSSIVNVTADAGVASPAVQDSTLNVKNISGADTGSGAAAKGVINIAGVGDYTATLSLAAAGVATGVYNDSTDFVVNIGAKGRLDLSDATVNASLAAPSGTNILEGMYNLDGGTLNVADLTINSDNLVSEKGMSANVGQINFKGNAASLLDVDGTLSVGAAGSGEAVIDTAVNIQTQSLEDGSGTGGITLGASNAQVNSVLTFTGGGEIKLALNVTGNTAGGGVVHIGIAGVTDESSTIATGDIKIFEYGKATVHEKATLSLQDASVSGAGILNVAGGTLNALDTNKNATDLDLSATNIVLSNGGTLGSLGKETTLGSAKFTVDTNGSGHIAGDLVANNVNTSNASINGTLNVAGKYSSAAANTFAGTGMIDVAGNMNFANGANDFFLLNTEAANVHVTGSDNLSADNPNQADARVSFGGTVTVADTVNLTGGGATTAHGGTTQMVAAGTLEAQNVHIIGGVNTANFKGGGSQLVLNKGTIGNVTITGGDVDTTTTLTSSMNNAEFVVQALGNLDNTVTIGTVTMKNGANALAAPTYGQGIAALIVAGGNYENGGEGRQTHLIINGTVTGDGMIVVQGGTGETGGSRTGGNAVFDISNADLSGFTGTYSSQGGQGGDANAIAGGGKGGSVTVYGNNGQAYDFVGGSGGDAFGEFDGGAGGDLIFNAGDGDSYTKISLTGGKAGADDPSGAGLGGAGGAVEFLVERVVSTVDTLIVNDGGQVNVLSFNDDPAALSVDDNFTDVAGARIFINGGTLDLSAAAVNVNAEGVATDLLAGAYAVRDNGKLVLDNVSIDTANFVSTHEIAAGQIQTIGGGMLVVKDTLTLGGKGTMGGAIHIETKSLAGVDATMNGGMLKLVGGGSIHNALTVAGGTLVVAYTEDNSTNSATIIGTTTLSAGTTLTVTAESGLNILGGTTLDVRGGTVIVGANGFAHLEPDELKQANMLGEPGLGTLIVDNKNLGFSHTEGTVSYADSANKVADAFWGTLQVTGLEGATLSWEEYNKFLVGGENALIQGANATLKLVNVELDDSGVLSKLKAGTVLDESVGIGSGVVDNGGSIIVGSVAGDLQSSIVIENGSDVSITGEPDGGVLFTQLGSTSDVQVKNGTVRLGLAGNSISLSTGIILGDIADASIDGDVATTGNVFVYGNLDMSAQTISSFAGSHGNTVNVLSGGALVTHFDMGADDTLNVIADTASAGADLLTNSTLGDVNVIGSTQAIADATMHIKGHVTAYGDVTLTGNAGDARLNIVGGDDNGANVSLQVRGSFTNNNGILNLTAGDAGATDNGGNAVLHVDGVFTSTAGMSLTGGDGAAGHDGGSVSVYLGSADLGNVAIASGVNGTGIGGSAELVLSNGSAADVRLMNTVADMNGAKFTVTGGSVAAQSVTLHAASGAANSELKVWNGTLTVTDLDASAGSIDVSNSEIFVVGSYTDAAETLVTISKIYVREISPHGPSEALNLLDLSDTATDSLQGKYTLLTDSILQMGTLNIASTDLVPATLPLESGQIHFIGGTLITDTLNLTDAATATLSAGNIMTSTLNTNDLGVTVNTALTFTGGGVIDADINTGTGSVTIGATAGIDGSETAATTTTLGEKMTLDITNTHGLNVLEGNALDTTKGTLKVADGGFAATGTGQLIAKEQDFGAFTIDAAEKTFASFDNSNANVQDVYFGDLVITGLNGISMTQDEYESFLIAGNNALIEGSDATLKFDGIRTLYDDDVVLGDLAAGTNADDQIFETGASTPGTASVDVNNGGKVTVGGVANTSGTVTDLIIKNGTTLVATGQGEAQGNAFSGSVTVESGAGFETGATGGNKTTVGGSVIIAGESSPGAGDGGKYTAIGDTNIADGITASGTAGGQSLEVETGASLTVGTNATGDIDLPAGSMTVKPGGSVAAQNIEIKELFIGDADGEGETSGSLTVSSLTVTGGQVKSGDISVLASAHIGDFTFGSDAIDGQALYSAGSTSISGLIGFDPAWSALASENTMDKATQGALGAVTFDAAAAGEVGIYVGRNSMVAIGTKDTSAFMNDLQAFVDDGEITWGNPADNADNTSAAIAFYEGLTLTNNASLVVNGDYVHAADSTNPAGVWNYESTGAPVTFTPNTAIFAANSLALIDAPAFLKTESVVLTAGTGSDLTVHSDAKLVIVDGKGGQYINVAEGFDTVTIDTNSTMGESAWSGENLLSSSSLIDATVVTGATELTGTDYENSNFVVKLTNNDANTIYPLLDSSMGNHINDMVNEIGTDVLAANAGQRFISRLTDNSGVYGFGDARPTEVAAIIASAAQMAQVGAVNRGIMDASMSASSATIARNTFSELGANAQNVAAVNMDASGGLSAGSDTADMKNGVGLWLMPLYKWNNVSAYKAGAFEYDYSSGLGGMGIGADYTVNNMFRFGVTFNLGAGYADSTGDLSETTNNFDFWGLGVYGAFSQNNFNVVADLAYTETYNEIDQQVPSVLGMGNNSVEVNASAVTLGLTAEYLIKTDVMDIIPHAGVRFMSVSTADYDVQNGGTVFSVESENQNVWYFPVGLTFQKDIAIDNGWHFTPKLDLGFIAAAGDLNTISKATIPGVSGSAELEMRNVDSFAFNGGLGFELDNKSSGLSFGLNYTIQASEHEAGHMLNATFRFEF